MKLDTGCCGSHINAERATLIGVMTLSFPLSVLLFLPVVLTAPLCVFPAGRRLRRGLIALWKANLALTQTCALWPRARC